MTTTLNLELFDRQGEVLAEFAAAYARKLASREAPDDGGLFDGFEEELAQFLREADPRPDLADDSHFWQRVLREALRHHRDVWGLLHGLRCAGCRIVLQESGALKLDYTAMLEDSPDVRERLLLPHQRELAKIFAAVAPRRKPKEDTFGVEEAVVHQVWQATRAPSGAFSDPITRSFRRP